MLPVCWRIICCIGVVGGSTLLDSLARSGDLGGRLIEVALRLQQLERFLCPGEHRFEGSLAEIFKKCQHDKYPSQDSD